MKRFFLLSIVASLSLPAFSSDIIFPPGPFEETKVVLIDEFKNLVVLMNMECAHKNGLQKLNQFPELELVDHTPPP